MAASGITITNCTDITTPNYYTNNISLAVLQKRGGRGTRGGDSTQHFITLHLVENQGELATLAEAMLALPAYSEMEKILPFHIPVFPMSVHDTTERKRKGRGHVWDFHSLMPLPLASTTICSNLLTKDTHANYCLRRTDV